MGSTIRFLDPARPVDPGDVSAVARLGAQLGYPAGREEFERRLERVLAEPAGAVLLAEEEGVVVGWLHVQALASVVDEPYALISGLVVDETLRGRGVGRALVAAAEGWASARGLLRVQVRSRESRDHAHRFYLGLGFELHKKQHLFRRLLRTD